MKIKVPKPVSPLPLIGRKIFFNSDYNDLETLLDSVYLTILKACETLGNGEFSIAEYLIAFFRETEYRERFKFFGEYLEGGFNLSIPDQGKSSIKYLIDRCQDSFDKLKKDYKKDPGHLMAIVEITGYRDSITHEIDIGNFNDL